jgi:ornithine carbamoyltransferase
MAVRTFAHRSLEILAEYADVPVINALSDWEHPCQALADLLTIYEKKGEFQGLTLAYIGDGNNCARSLMLAASMVGINFRIASPPGYTMDEQSLKLAKSHALSSGGGVFCTEDPALAASGADAVYTDVWTSMGQEAEAEERNRAFKGYQITTELLDSTNDGAIFLHPLPAHQGEEIAEGILDNPRSVVFDQAENRLHVQKAVLAQKLGGLDISLPRYR